MSSPRKQIVLVSPHAAYRVDDFLAAAARAGVDVLLAEDRCHVLDQVYAWPAERFVVDYYDVAAAAETIVARARAGGRVAAIVPTEGELPALVAARAARALGLPHLPVEAAEAARDKRRMLELCAAAGVPVPRFALVPTAGDAVAPLPFPCVLKPTFLSASRGVIRADDAAGFAAARARIARLLAIPEVRELSPAAAEHVLVEEFIPGPEVALEGMVSDGALEVLALFDKPDPLDGPFFEETIYVTPSRHAPELQAAVQSVTQAATRAMGVSDGPIHAELRLAPRGPVVIEIAARSIGGLCGRTLRLGTGMSLEDVIVRHALGERVRVGAQRDAAGVMMLPIPGPGVLRGVDGLEAARAVAGVTDVVITAPIESELVPLPEGSSYLGFLFARGADPAFVEQALRTAQANLRVRVTPILPIHTEP